MKKLFANKKIQVVALAVICIAIVIAVLSLNEQRKEELIPDLTRQQLENSEEVMFYYEVQRLCTDNMYEGTADEIEERFREQYPAGEFTWIEEYLNGYLYVMQDGKVYYVEECVTQSREFHQDPVTETAEQAYLLGSFSTIDLWRLHFYASQVNFGCDYRTLSQPVSYESPMGGGGGTGGNATEMEMSYGEIDEFSTCNLRVPGRIGLFLVQDNRMGKMAMDDYAKAIRQLFLESSFFETMQEMYLNRYNTMAE